MSITATLEAIRSILEDRGRPVTQRLNGGLSEAESRSFEATIGVRFPATVVELVGWRNGTELYGGETIDQLCFFPGYYLMSIQDAVERYASLRSSAPREWKKHWLPLFASGAGDFYAVECRKSEAADGAIICYFRGNPVHPIVFGGLKQMISTIHDRYLSGEYFVDNEGRLTTS